MLKIKEKRQEVYTTEKAESILNAYIKKVCKDIAINGNYDDSSRFEVDYKLQEVDNIYKKISNTYNKKLLEEFNLIIIKKENYVIVKEKAEFVLAPKFKECLRTNKSYQNVFRNGNLVLAY